MTISSTIPDLSQRQEALNPSQSFIVQAPAGSGKTELLIQRILKLLSYVNEPEEILAITFTKKAANEMRARIVTALKECHSDKLNETTQQLAQAVLQRDQELQWHLIENPNRLRVQTIDSLNANLTRQLPILSHLGHPPAIADDPGFLYRETVQEVLAHLEENVDWSNAIGKLLFHLDNNPSKLQQLLMDLLAKRDQWLAYIFYDENDPRLKKILEQQLAAVITEHLESLREKIPAELAGELVALANIAAQNLSSHNPESPIMACLGLTQLPSSDANDKARWLGLAELLLTKDLKWRKQVTISVGFPPPSSTKNASEKIYLDTIKKRISELLNKLSHYPQLQLLWAELIFLPEPTFQSMQWEILQATMQILKVLVAQLRLTFQKYSQIDYTENAQAALLALGQEESPTDLALALDYQIQHILIDEFQDTSYSQYRLLEKLTSGWQANDGRTLFIVGDPMQSIYRFREAEVGLFIRTCKQGIGHIPLRFLSLSTNFRSISSIVDWINHHFKQIFPIFNDVATGSVVYHSSLAFHTQSQEEPFPNIELNLFADKEKETQAEAIAEQIKKLKQHNPEERIAILVRSRTHLSEIIPALKTHRIAYQAIDIDPLSTKQTIQDLSSLTRALLHPGDRLAWLAILRAPWCGCTLQDLWLIANEAPNKTLLHQLNNKELLQQLSPFAQQRLSHVLPILQQKIANRRRQSLRNYIESTWLLLGGPACVQHPTELEDANAYFNLLDKLDEGSDITSFQKLDEGLAKLYASCDSHVENSLQIMTIHAAKGLEFDTVILPHLERGLTGDDKSLISWMERPLTHQESAVLLAPIHATGDKKDAIYEYIKRQQTIKADYETVRLLYVAATRAKKRLYLFAQLAMKENNELSSPKTGTFLDKLWATTQQSPIMKPNLLTAADLHRAPVYLRRLSSEWKNPLQDILLTEAAAHNKPGIQVPARYAKLVGTLTHQILQNISLHGISWWTEQTDEQRQQFILQRSRQTGIYLNDLMNASQNISFAIKNILNDERGRWILAPHAESQSELTLTTLIENKIKSIIIDRTFVDENNVRWIIDYKTSTFTEGDLAKFLSSEKEKYLQQMMQYQKAIQQMEQRPIRLGLYFPLIPAWYEWE